MYSHTGKHGGSGLNIFIKKMKIVLWGIYKCFASLFMSPQGWVSIGLSNYGTVCWYRRCRYFCLYVREVDGWMDGWMDMDRWVFERWHGRTHTQTWRRSKEACSMTVRRRQANGEDRQKDRVAAALNLLIRNVCCRSLHNSLLLFPHYLDPGCL